MKIFWMDLLHFLRSSQTNSDRIAPCEDGSQPDFYHVIVMGAVDYHSSCVVLGCSGLC